MKKLTALSAIFLAAAMLLGGCAEANGTRNGVTVTKTQLPATAILGDIACDFPLLDKTVSLNIMITQYSNIAPEDVFVWKKYEQMTNVHAVWTGVSKKDRSEAVYTALANKAKLNLIMRCKISATTLTQYGESGLILDLAKDKLLENYAPNCWAYLQSHPDALASITNPDGSIYALPQINSGAELRVSRKIFVNKKWLENVNMSLPTTTEELYTLLKAFKEQDANGNGDATDEIPLCSAEWLSVKEAFYGAFGLANRGIHNTVVDCDEETGAARLMNASDDYKAYLEYFNRLYSEGLLDKSVFSITTAEWENNAKNDRIGMFVSTNLAGLPANLSDNWVAADEALEGPNGDKMWSAIRANFHSTGAAIIPSTCENPELVLRWLDYFWTDEGTLFYHMGTEGETFIANDDGTYDYTTAIYDEITSSGKTFDDIVAQYSPYPGGSNPMVEVAPYFAGGEMADVPAAAALKLFEYGPSEYWPCFTFTAEENERLNVLQSDISKYCSTATNDFITGVTPLTEWDKYTSQLAQMGQDELVSIYQTAIDRYNALKSNS